MARDDDPLRSIAKNRKARHDYEILDEYEAGIVLRGTEVKSLRAGRASIQEAYVLVRADGADLIGSNIPEYPQAGPRMNHPPDRARPLLLHRRELGALRKRATEKGITVVPLELYFRGPLVKLAIGLARGKKLHDKRQTERDREDRREMRRAMGKRR
ncbi:MAG: SsrA-binding protein SmpB [Planctomycetota bacterium]